jgi:competence protein ComEA
MKWIRKNWMLFVALLALLAMAPLGFAGDKQADKTAPGAKQKASAGTLGDERRHRKIDINTADRETLLSLPGVGPATADAIIAARPFKNVGELQHVKGIGEVRFKDLQKQVTVRPAPHAPVGAPPKAEGGQSSDHKRTVRPAHSDERGSKNPNAAPPATRPQGKINLNTATLEELESLPEIGPVKAQAIIDARPYRTPEDVMKVKGIKEGTYERIKDQITVR